MASKIGRNGPSHEADVPVESEVIPAVAEDAPEEDTESTEGKEDDEFDLS